VTPEPLPDGCFKYTDSGCIAHRDINRDRPGDQCNVSTERLIRRSLDVEHRRPWFRRAYWVVYSIAVYEMAGDYRSTYIGGRCWAETDHTGREWWFREEAAAMAFARGCP